jgi:hypothetical protein
MERNDMLRILLVIAVALAVIIGLMKLTGTRSDNVSPASEDAAAITEDAADAMSEEAGGAAGDAIDASGEPVSDALDAPLEEPAGETGTTASEAPAVEAPAAEAATDPAAEEPSEPN